MADFTALMTEHLDLPWRVQYSPMCFTVYTTNGSTVVDLDYDDTDALESEGARVSAYLIAAAPEMFKALRLALPHVQACAEHDRDNEEAARAHGMDGLAAEAHKMVAMRLAAVDMIRLALAKVEDKQ